ncbi:hypothetical protein QCD79_30735, partial [Pseudomonas quasicaspiana]|nr:hypothetical protein [Pseudomonas quasicaspiana]
PESRDRVVLGSWRGAREDAEGLTDTLYLHGRTNPCGSGPGIPDTALSRSKRVTCRIQLVGETSDPHRQKFRFANKLAPRSAFQIHYWSDV